MVDKKIHFKNTSSDYTDINVLIFFFLFSTTLTFAGFIPEILVKIINGENHLSNMSFYVYMGATTRDLNSAPRGRYSLMCSLMMFGLSLITYRVLKARS